MKATSATFGGSLGDLVRTLREAGRTRNRSEVIRIFPDTGRNRSITGDIDSMGEYCKNPTRRLALLRGGKVRIIIPFFENQMPQLEKILHALYPDAGLDATKCLRESFNALTGKLKKIRQYFHLSCADEFEVDNANKKISGAIEEFNTSLPLSFSGWKISPECYRPRTRPSKRVTICGHTFRPRPAPREWEFTFPLTIAEIDKLINFAETWANRLKNRPKTGRPPLPFNALLFHVVNGFTQRCLTAKREYIMKDGKFRVRKNWQLVCAALLWLHVLYDIPEIRAFIKTHENEEAHAALKKLVSWAKSEYSHFRESGKGRGKFGPAFADGAEWLNIPWVYLREDGSLSGRLL